MQSCHLAHVIQQWHCSVILLLATCSCPLSTWGIRSTCDGSEICLLSRRKFQACTCKFSSSNSSARWRSIQLVYWLTLGVVTCIWCAISTLDATCHLLIYPADKLISRPRGQFTNCPYQKRWFDNTTFVYTYHPQAPQQKNDT